MGSSVKSFSTRVFAATEGAHWAETEAGKASMVGSLSPGIWGSGLRGKVTPTSGPPAGTSGMEGMVMGWPMAGSILTVPSGWSWGSVSCSCLCWWWWCSCSCRWVCLWSWSCECVWSAACAWSWSWLCVCVSVWLWSVSPPSRCSFFSLSAAWRSHKDKLVMRGT